MAEIDTLAIKREIMEMPLDERANLVKWINDSILRAKSIEIKAPGGRAAELLSVMEEVTGEKILPGVQRARFVWCRAMVAYWMSAYEAVPGIEIGRQMGLNHSTIRHYIMKMQDVFDYPLMYDDILSQWERFTAEISNTKKITS